MAFNIIIHEIILHNFLCLSNVPYFTSIITILKTYNLNEGSDDSKIVLYRH